MPYQVRLSHIHPDYSVEPPPTDTWSAVVEEDDDLIVMLNRVAIASSQNPSHEYPVIDVVAGSIRATITVIGGQLYYTDPNAPNRSNIRVVADSALQLLHGSSLESVLQAEAAMDDDDDESPVASGEYRRSGVGPRARATLLTVLLTVLTCLLATSWKQLTYRPSLVPDYEFTPRAIAGMEMRAYSGIYVEGYQEGGQVLELTDEGQLKLYEMWHSTETSGFTLRQIESLELRLGAQGDKPALMAGEFYLLLPRGDDRILMSGVLFRRHIGSLGDIGKVQSL